MQNKFFCIFGLRKSGACDGSKEEAQETVLSRKVASLGADRTVRLRILHGCFLPDDPGLDYMRWSLDSLAL